jgi:hypothetical protein
MSPLNPLLFRALQRYFGNVRISNDGLAAKQIPKTTWDHRGKPRRSVEVIGGEYYCVDCPFCGDIRQRLQFNYLWGQEDERTGRPLLHLVHCFNEGCIDDLDVQRDLHDRVFPVGIMRSKVSLQSHRPAADMGDPRTIRARLPQNALPLTDPEIPRFVIDYLRQRQLDPELLWRCWKVRFCEFSESPPPKIRNRIVIPVGIPGPSAKKLTLVGWQARSIGDEPSGNGVPKYLSSKGFKKSQAVYGLHLAARSKGPVVLCEGVSDVWRLDRNAVSLFGKSLSTPQRDLITRKLAGRPLVVFLDQDALDDARAVARTLRSARFTLGEASPVAVAELPSHLADPGDCKKEQAWEFVAAALGWSRKKLAKAVG